MSTRPGVVAPVAQVRVVEYALHRGVGVGVEAHGAGQVQPSAHATRVRLDHAVGGLDEVELLEQLFFRGNTETNNFRHDVPHC